MSLNSIEVLLESFKKNQIGNKHINSSSFYSMMFYIAYAVNKNVYSWSNIPYASELSNTFALEIGISYAVMNLSKFSNQSEIGNLIGGWLIIFWIITQN